jgi:hypothetical protein
MSVSYDFSKCKNEAKEIQPYAYFVCTYIMAIGMCEITQKNHLEVYARLRMLDGLSFSGNSTLIGKNKWGQEVHMNLELVKSLIGAKFSGRHINVETRAKFSSRMFRGLLRDIEYLERAKSQEVA